MFFLVALILIIGGLWIDRSEKKKTFESYDEGKFIQSIKKFNPRAGDLIVIRTPYRLHEKLAKDIGASIQKHFPASEFKIMVLEQGMDIESSPPPREVNHQHGNY